MVLFSYCCSAIGLQAPQTPDSINQACGEDVSYDSFVDFERPIGGKAEKAKQKRKESEKEAVAVFMERKTRFLEDAHEAEKELIRIKKKKICLIELTMTEKINIKKERLRFEQAKEDEKMRREDAKMRRENERLWLKRIKQEERIMMIDMSVLSERQKQYYDQLQMEILESQKKKA